MEEDLDMDIKIISVTEINDQLRVVVETAYGRDSLGLSLDDKFLDPYTEKPRWMNSVRILLTKKYAPKNKVPKQLYQDLVGQTMNLNDMKTEKIPGFKIRLMSTLKFNKADAETIMAVYEDPIQLRIDVMEDKPLPFKSSINDILEKYYGGTGLGFDSDERPEIVELKKQGLLDAKGRPTSKMDSKQAGVKK